MLRARQLADFLKKDIPAVIDMMKSNDKRTNASTRRYFDLMDIINETKAQKSREVK